MIDNILKLPASALLLALFASLFTLYPSPTASAQSSLLASGSLTQPAEWTSRGVQHVYGLPDVQPKDKGTLALTASGLTFTGKAGAATIPRQSVIAVGAGNQRVEIWGMKGQILRAVIPDGGGVAAAMVMQHRVDMLTVEFADSRGAYHGAVFFLPANEATHALESFSRTPIAPRPPQESNACEHGQEHGQVWPNSILLSAPNWDHAEVPAAYRALVYERLFDRLQQVKGVHRVYRDGEPNPQQGCPQYTMQISVSGFRQGNQVKRAVLGPVGFFVGTTQMKFDATVTDTSGNVDMRQQITATVRGETESTNVAANIAKKLAKQYSAVLKKTGESSTPTAHPRQL